MKVLLIDYCGLGLDFSIRAQRAGHKVKHFINDPRKLSIGKGFVDVVREWDTWKRWADLIVLTDNEKYLHLTDSLRREGIPVFGPSPASARLETQRDEGMATLKKAGVPVPGGHACKSFDEAIAHVRKTMKRYVCKPIDGSVEDKSLSYCSKSPQDMVYMLERWKKLNQGALKGGLLLQEFIAGVEFAVGGWFGPHGFNRGLCENFEFKKLFPGDLGVATGEMGTVLAYTRKSKLAEKVLIPVESLLARLGHVGYVDVNCIIDDHGAPWPLEFTMRPGWPTFNIQQVLHKGDPVVWMAELCDGYDSRNTIDNEVALGTCVAIPDFPYSNLTKKEVCGIPVYGITPGMWEYFHPCEMQMCTVPKQVGEQIVNCPTPATAGDYVCVMTATAPTIAKARERVYRRLKRLEIPNSPMYRIDLGLRLKSQLPELQRHGYATAFQYS